MGYTGALAAESDNCWLLPFFWPRSGAPESTIDRATRTWTNSRWRKNLGILNNCHYIWWCLQVVKETRWPKRTPELHQRHVMNRWKRGQVSNRFFNYPSSLDIFFFFFFFFLRIVCILHMSNYWRNLKCLGSCCLKKWTIYTLRIVFIF